MNDELSDRMAKRLVDEPGVAQLAFCAAVVDEWVRSGVSDAVVAPGSRSTPLVAALAADARIRLHLVLDERSAGFFGLGLALASSRAVVVVTTSGTASVELHPAVAEAFQAGVPLIAATADRPPELHQVGAPQTLPQRNLFAGMVRFQAELGVPGAETLPAWRSFAARAVKEACCGPAGPGPVHLNLCFRDPLVVAEIDELVAELPLELQGRPGSRAWHGPALPRVPGPPEEELVSYLASQAGTKGLVVAGAGAVADRGEAKRLLEAAGRLGWPVLADPRSGLRVPHPQVVAAADSLLRHPKMAGSIPEVVVHTGDPWASKVLGEWLGSLPKAVGQVLVDPKGRWADPRRRASWTSASSAAALLEEVAARVDDRRSSCWAGLWSRAEAAAQAVFDAELGAEGRLALSEPAVARALTRAWPEGGRLVVSSSMPVRDLEWFGAVRPGLEVLSNRGVNGIDGVLSTALGAASADGAPTALLIGDLAFLYDAASLLWARQRPVSLSVLVLDNNGGGIFSFLPQAKLLASERFERFWGTPHDMDLTALAQAYGLSALGLDRREELEEFLAGATEPGVRVGVVQSSRQANVGHHDEINVKVARSLDLLFAQPSGSHQGCEQGL